jgi:hypothetical protein
MRGQLSSSINTWTLLSPLWHCQELSRTGARPLVLLMLGMCEERSEGIGEAVEAPGALEVVGSVGGIEEESAGGLGGMKVQRVVNRTGLSALRLCDEKKKYQVRADAVSLDVNDRQNSRLLHCYRR